MRLAEEYDAAQDRGEVRQNGERTFSGGEKVGAADIGLSGKDIHEARRFREAEQESPGTIQRAIDGMVERGEDWRTSEHSDVNEAHAHCVRNAVTSTVPMIRPT